MNDEGSDPLNPLPQTLADQTASTIEPAGSAKRATDAMEIDGAISSDPYVEDEDLELQRVLQESLVAARHNNLEFSAGAEAAASAAIPDEAFAAFQASAARSRKALADARRHQEMAMQEVRDEAPIAVPQPTRRRTAGEDEEEEMLRQAIEQSLNAQSQEDADMYEALRSSAKAATQTREKGLPEAGPTSTPAPNPLPARSTSRTYDDEDAELQAALKASLESMPPDFTVPDSPPRVNRRTSPQAVAGTSTGAKQAAQVPPPPEPRSSPPESPAQERPPTMDEIRRMRLARFGG